MRTNQRRLIDELWSASERFCCSFSFWRTLYQILEWPAGHSERIVRDRRPAARTSKNEQLESNLGGFVYELDLKNKQKSKFEAPIERISRAFGSSSGLQTAY